MTQKTHILYPALVAGLVVIGISVFFGVRTEEAVKENPSQAATVSRTIMVGADFVEAELADTIEERARGLSGRTELKDGEGMLFVFDEDGLYSFWMKDMLIPIDMFWLSAEGEIVYIVESVAPESYPESFVSERPARFVLELPAGYAAAHEVSVGDIVRL